jgi:hypothetical protein
VLRFACISQAHVLGCLQHLIKYLLESGEQVSYEPNNLDGFLVVGSCR